MTTPPPAAVVLRIPTITIGYWPDNSPVPQPLLQPILQFKDSDSPSHNQRHRAWKEWLAWQKSREAVRVRSQPVIQPQPFHPYVS